MTSTLLRPRHPALPDGREADPGHRPLLVDGALTALLAALVGLLLVCLPVVLAWVADERAGSSAVETVRTAGPLWLAAHGASLTTPAGAVGLTPLGLLLVPGYLLYRGNRRLAADRAVAATPHLCRAVGSIAVPYALLAALVAVSSAGQDLRVAPIQAAVGAFVLAVVAGAGGALRGSSVEAGLLFPSGRVARLGRATGVATAGLLGGGALLVAVSLGVHLSTAADLGGAAGTGPVGGLVLLLVSLAHLPNAVVWGGSWLAGPGFAVGIDTAVGPFGYDLGPVPALPLLAAVPTGPAPGWLGVLALAVPVAAGLVAGRLLHRDRAHPTAPRSATGSPEPVAWRRVLGEPLVVAAATGLLWGAMAWLAGGAVGSGRLAQTGPDPVSAALAVAGVIGAAAAVGAVVSRAADGRGRPG